MYLEIGKCYAVLLQDGRLVRFRFEGCDKGGRVVAELPPGSGKQVQLYELIGVKKWVVYWLVPEPKEEPLR